MPSVLQELDRSAVGDLDRNQLPPIYQSALKFVTEFLFIISCVCICAHQPDIDVQERW
jgi:hypothetical protein